MSRVADSTLGCREVCNDGSWETLAETLAEDFVPPVSHILGSSGVPERASIVIPCFLVPLQT